MTAALVPLGVEVDVEAPQELNHSSYALAGLFELEHAGLIDRVRVLPHLGRHRGELEVRADGDLDHSSFRSYKTTYFTVRRGRARVRAALDFRDSASIFPADALEGCDVLYKRSFEDRPVGVVVDRFGTTIEPAGLSFRVASAHARRGRLIRANYAVSSMLGATHIDRRLLTRWRREVRSVRQHLGAARSTVGIDDLAPAGGTPGDVPTILFQTRTFDRTDDEDANRVHQDRADLIRALRREFGPRFVGGFIPDDLSRRAYPDCLTSLPSDPRSYFEAMNRATVVVYTRGLVDSVAWKLSEYLALGKCIVGEHLATRLPAPLTGTDAISTFATADECAATGHALLADEPRRLAMQAAARRYFDEWVEPGAAMYRMVQRALDVGAG